MRGHADASGLLLDLTAADAAPAMGSQLPSTTKTRSEDRTNVTLT